MSTTVYADLVLEGGELVRIEYARQHEDEMLESLEHAMKRGDWWAPSLFDGCKANYLGHHIERVNMRKVVAML